jgi:hypothetical protein
LVTAMQYSLNPNSAPLYQGHEVLIFWINTLFKIMAFRNLLVYIKTNVVELVFPNTPEVI